MKQSDMILSWERIGYVLTVFVTLLFGCQGEAVRSPKEWQAVAQKEVAERLRTNYDTVFEDAGFIKASSGRRTDVYGVVDDRVEHFFSLEGGSIQGFEYEWTTDGALWFVTTYVNGDPDGISVEFDHGRGQQYVREYRQGRLISTDSIPLTDRPRIKLFSPPSVHGPSK